MTYAHESAVAQNIITRNDKVADANKSILGGNITNQPLYESAGEAVARGVEYIRAARRKE